MSEYEPSKAARAARAEAEEAEARVNEFDQRSIDLRASAAPREDRVSTKAERDQAVEQMHFARARASMQEWADQNGMTLNEAVDHWMGRLTDDGDPGRWIQAKLLKGEPGKLTPTATLEARAREGNENG